MFVGYVAVHIPLGEEASVIYSIDGTLYMN